MRFDWRDSINSGVCCARCNKLVFESWIRQADNKPVCGECFYEYHQEERLALEAIQ